MLNEIKFLWQSRPVYLIYWVSQACNFTCEHCFNHEENKKRAKELTLDEIRKFSSSFGHIKYLTLAGGEPFIRQDLLEIATIFCEQNDLHHLNVITNGWFTDRTVEFSKKFIERFPRIHLNINVSMDGFEKEHDIIRQKKGSFRRCTETLAALKDISHPRLEVAVNTVYNSANASTMESFGYWVVDHLGVTCAVNLVRGESIQNETYRAVDIDHYLLVAKRIHNKNLTLRPSSPIAAVQMGVLDIIEDSVKHNRQTLPCQAGKKGIVLTAPGDLLLCEILNIRLGNIRDHDYDVRKILDRPDSQKHMAHIFKSKCHCTWECFQGLNTVFAPKMYPKIALRSLMGFPSAPE